MDDGGASVLAEGQDALDSSLGIAQKLQRYILVILRRLGVAQDGSHLLVVLTAEGELYVVERLLSQQRERFLAYFQYFFAFKFASAYTLGAEQAILRCVRAKLEHGSILKIWSCHVVLFIMCYCRCRCNSVPRRDDRCRSRSHTCWA